MRDDLHEAVGGVGIESTEEECWAKTGKAPVTTIGFV